MTDPVISDLHRYLSQQEEGEALQEEAELLREDPAFAGWTDEELYDHILDQPEGPDDEYYPEDFYPDSDDRG